MPQLLFGIFLLAGVWMTMRWFAEASPTGLVRGVKTTGLLLALVLVVVLAVTGRLGWALAGLAALLPWGMRLLRLHRLWRWAAARQAPASRPAATRSTVQGRFVEMSIDHQDERLEGRVLEGPLSGRALSSLSLTEVLELRRQAAADQTSERLLETWLDRYWPDWRRQDPPAASSGDMDIAEARSILGIDEQAGPEEIRAAHRRLIAKLHPDAGGSHYLAAKINRAKDILLGE